MTFESSISENRFHFELSARFKRSLERDYSIDSRQFSGRPSDVNSYREGGFYHRASSINVLERALSDGLGKRIEFGQNGYGSSPARIIAKNVLNHVRLELREARSGGAGEEDLQSIIDQARQGIERGFSSAREVLQGRVNTESRLGRQLDYAFNKIQRGLQRLDDRFTPNIETTPIDNSSTQTSLLGLQQPSVNIQQIEVTKTIEVQRSRSFNLSIETQEGDTVTFSIEQFYSRQASKDFAKDENGFTVNVNRQTKRGEEVSYQVNGDINEQEQAAIDALIKKVDRLADKFYSGNIAAAFTKAVRVGIDAEQLASFSLNLQSTKSVEITRTYREIQGIPAEQQLPSPVEAVGEFAGEVAAAVSEEPVAKFIADPVSVATDLFKQIVIRDERYANLLLEKNVEVLDELSKTIEDQLAKVAQ